MRMSVHTVSVAFISLALGLVFAIPSSAADSTWTRPTVDGQITRSFDHSSTYGPGHRGIDFSTQNGSQVRAVAAGRVMWAGKVAGRFTITIDHGAEKSTYDPVKPSVSAGDRVSAGQVIGHVSGRHKGCKSACLHLGRVSGSTYLDPAERLREPNGYRLISPRGAPPKPPQIVLGSGSIPVAGAVTSRFGMRTHPITGRRAFHDGIDFGAPCGTPVYSVAAGTVKSARWDGGYGIRVVINHTGNRGSAYAHLSKAEVRAGSKVKRGQRIGLVGTTGRSTGCHLHFMSLRDGRAINPA